MKGILFNQDMVRAILDGRKSVTRRVIKPAPLGLCYEDGSPARKPPYRPGDILYVRERVAQVFGRYIYRADYEEVPEDTKPFWKPSIHMPKYAARIFLRVKGLKVERLQDITEEQALSEGIRKEYQHYYDNVISALEVFQGVWDSTIKKADLPRYGWDANPYVFCIEFEKISKEEALGNAQ